MISLPVASIWVTLLGVLFGLVSLLLIFIILIQKGKGGGLGGAFGGAGGGGGLLGTKTGDFLTWVTISLVIFFFLLAIVLVKFGEPKLSDDLRNKPVETQQAIPGETDGEPDSGDLGDSGQEGKEEAEKVLPGKTEENPDNN